MGWCPENFHRKFERFFNIEEGDIALDVGACVGDTTVPMAQKVGSEGLVIAVEPHPDNTKFLKLNTSRFGNVEIVEKAAWNETKKLSLFVSKAITGHALIKEFRTQQIQVEAITLDDMTEHLAKLDYVKIDVQGVEVQVLEGASHMLDKTRKIVVETHYRYNDKCTYPRVAEMLRRKGFLVRVAPDGIVHGILGL